jgi:hypothetical protein
VEDESLNQVTRNKYKESEKSQEMFAIGEIGNDSAGDRAF